MGTGEFTAGGKPCDGLASHPGGVAIHLFASRYGNRDKLRPDGPLGSYTDFFLLTWHTDERPGSGDCCLVPLV